MGSSSGRLRATSHPWRSLTQLHEPCLSANGAQARASGSSVSRHEQRKSLEEQMQQVMVEADRRILELEKQATVP